MPDYALTGRKGTGKSKNAIRIAKIYLTEGRKVATNLDINLVAMFGTQSRISVVRIPDKPTAFDLEAVGMGNDSYDEDKNGALILDELATWMNARTFGDKGRSDLLDFFAHGRKRGWDTYYIMQNILQVDKQVRESFIEFTVRHVRFDKVKIPLFGGILGALFGDKWAYLPRFHQASTRLGTGPTDLVTNRVYYRGDDLHGCYDTRQVFRFDYPHGSHSLLSPWHTHGRYEKPVKVVPLWSRLLGLVIPLREFEPLPARPVAPEVARVMALAKRLPPGEAAAVLARFYRRLDGGNANAC